MGCEYYHPALYASLESHFRPDLGRPLTPARHGKYLCRFFCAIFDTRRARKTTCPRLKGKTPTETFGRSRPSTQNQCITDFTGLGYARATDFIRLKPDDSIVVGRLRTGSRRVDKVRDPHLSPEDLGSTVFNRPRAAPNRWSQKPKSFTSKNHFFRV